MLLAPHLALALMWNMSLNTDLFLKASQYTAEANNVQESHPTHRANHVSLYRRVSLGWKASSTADIVKNK